MENRLSKIIHIRIFKYTKEQCYFEKYIENTYNTIIKYFIEQQNNIINIKLSDVLITDAYQNPGATANLQGTYQYY
jgi:hypothetical protein